MPDQERYEADVRGWLDSQAVPPPRLDLDQIVQAGRAQVRRRRYLTASGVTATMLAVAVAVPVTTQAWRTGGGGGPDRLPGAPPALECTVTELPLPDELAEQGLELAWAEVVTVDPTGRYVVTSPGVQSVVPGPERNLAAHSVLIRWDGRAPTVLPTGTDATAVDVNANGVVVGHDQDGEQDLYHGWVYDRTLVRLPAPEGYRSVLVAGINQAGDVVGSAYRGPEDPTAVVLWPAADRDRPRILDSPGGRGVGAAGITDQGSVLGVFEDEEGGVYRWDAAGAGSELPLLDGASSGWIGQVAGGWAVGEVELPVPADQVETLPTPSGELGLPSPTGSPREYRPSSTPVPSTTPPSPRAYQPATITVPVRWDLTSGTVAPVPGYEPGGPLRTGGAEYGAVAVSAAGDAVVTDYQDTTVVRDGQPYSLPVPVAGAVAAPAAVNDDGTVFAGEVVRVGGPSPGPADDLTTVVWHC